MCSVALGLPQTRGGITYMHNPNKEIVIYNSSFKYCYEQVKYLQSLLVSSL